MGAHLAVLLLLGLAAACTRAEQEKADEDREDQKACSERVKDLEAWLAPLREDQAFLAYGAGDYRLVEAEGTSRPPLGPILTVQREHSQFNGLPFFWPGPWREFLREALTKERMAFERAGRRHAELDPRWQAIELGHYVMLQIERDVRQVLALAPEPGEVPAVELNVRQVP